MGRSSDTIAQWQGQTAEVRAVLESAEIILRGGIRERVPRGAITSMSVDQGWLRLNTDRGVLVLELGEVEAARWLLALQKPLPTLAEKLGVTPACLAFALAEAAPELGVWCVYPKGRKAAVTDAMVRGYFRDRGYVDSKACAVSAVLTATRYGRRRG